ncbi:type II toxin-antitoxin system Phd/YefM family antitoxin [Brevundimonas subvibrioides]|uniref:type II toxin-antitoxin system Phd/YefM family antitoxin n=1 Tax=Brevundimonas subvibrioides TaxID=74313 RepID=UPI0022B4C78E|nr:type II toxin-antitoxin system prevent-host-death family antitoxin [Brevundimonas subvibrioides]
MASYGVAEAKNNFTHLLDRVQEGESITITRHGKPIAELRATASPPTPRLTPAEKQAWYDEFVKRREARAMSSIDAVDLVQAMRDGVAE